MADTRVGEIAADAIILQKKKTVLSLFGNSNMSITKKRESAFKETFQLRSPSTQLIVEHAIDSQDAARLVHHHFEQHNSIDTIFCMSDEILIGAMKAIQEMNLNIPTDVSILSISNGFIPTLYHPSISYVETSGYQLGKLAFIQMMACLSGSDAMMEMTVDVKYIKGGSL